MSKEISFSSIKEIGMLHGMVKSYFSLMSCLPTKQETSILKKLERAMKPIKTRSAKNKGAKLQKWVCEKISEMLNIPYNQQDDDCLIHSREMGQSGVDIVLRGRAKGLFPFSIECKNSESLALLPTIQQAEKNAAEGRPYLIIHKRKRLKKPIVVMSWETFEKIHKKNN